MLLTNGLDQHAVRFGLHSGGSKGHVTCNERFALQDLRPFVLGNKICEPLWLRLGTRGRWLGLGLRSAQCLSGSRTGSINRLCYIKELFAQFEAERAIGPTDDPAVRLSLLDGDSIYFATKFRMMQEMPHLHPVHARP